MESLYADWGPQDWALLNRQIDESKIQARARVAHDRKVTGLYRTTSADDEAIERWQERCADNEKMRAAYDALDDKPEWAAWTSWWPDICQEADRQDELDLQNALRRGEA